jgi:wobble nucleotide-excising tRNase
MPIIKARERLEKLEKINAENIKPIILLAYNDEKLADSVQNQWLLNEQKRNAAKG